MIYITVDPYYQPTSYNRMLQALHNNGIAFSQWIDIRAPHYWYIKVQDSDMPKFVDFDVISKAEERFLVSVIEPLRSQDSYLLQRRNTDNPTDYGRFVMTDYWKEALDSNYMIIFKYGSPENIKLMTKELGIKVYELGVHRWKLSMGFNPYIKGYLQQDQILMEKTKEQMNEFRKPGALEAELSYRYLRNAKLEHKHLLTSYWKDGIKYPAIRST